jgi:hypothetical protein
MRGYRPINNPAGVSTMVQDVLSALHALKNIAIGRCHQRIEEAARKARELQVNGQTEENKKRTGPCNPPCCVTSILKRKHGL